MRPSASPRRPARRERQRCALSPAGSALSGYMAHQTSHCPLFRDNPEYSVPKKASGVCPALSSSFTISFTEGIVMTKWLWMSCLLVLATTSVVQAQAPAGSAQWSVDSGPVYTLDFHRLYNTKTEKHLYRKSNGELDWKTEAAGHGSAFFENCTRPGEVVYGSDRVALRYGAQFLVATGPSSRGWNSNREDGCQYRLIPSGAGLVPAGSGDHNFAIYNMTNNRYLFRGDSLIWKEMGAAPGGSVASADFVPEDLFYTVGTIGNSTIYTAYLTIKNVGNVRSSASQREMKVRLLGQEVDFPVLQPVEPGASLRNPIRLLAAPPQCVLVELDTRPDIKFQVLRGALPNDFVFLNDRRNMFARNTAGPTSNVFIQCEPTIYHTR
jgi:hypothetical protein